MIVLKLFLLSWVITRFKPLKMLGDILLLKTKSKPMVSILISIIMLFITCFTCCSFWLSLVITKDIFLAAGVSFIATWYEKYLGGKEEYITFN